MISSRTGEDEGEKRTKQAKSVCVPSSRLINSLEKVNPGINPLFLSQKMAAKLPEKKMPSTQANATSLTRKGSSSVMYFNAQSAFF